MSLPPLCRLLIPNRFQKTVVTKWWIKRSSQHQRGQLCVTNWSLSQANMLISLKKYTGRASLTKSSLVLASRTQRRKVFFLTVKGLSKGELASIPTSNEQFRWASSKRSHASTASSSMTTCITCWPTRYASTRKRKLGKKQLKPSLINSKNLGKIEGQ